MTGSYTDRGKFYVLENYAYINNFDGLKIIDVSDPSAPTLAGTYAGGEGEGIYVCGDYAYMVADQELKIINVSDPANPSVIAYYNNGDFGTNGIYVVGDQIYTAEGHYGFKVFSVE